MGKKNKTTTGQPMPDEEISKFAADFGKLLEAEDTEKKKTSNKNLKVARSSAKRASAQRKPAERSSSSRKVKRGSAKKRIRSARRGTEHRLNTMEMTSVTLLLPDYAYDFETIDYSFESIKNKLVEERIFINRDEITLDRLIANGEFGKVYRAHWRGLDCTAELCNPMTDENQDDTSKVRSDLANEVNALSLLRHPSVIQLIGAYIGTDESILITGDNPTGTLLQFAQSKEHNWKSALDHACHIAQGLSYLQGHGIMLRNLSPDCIYIVEDGTCKIANFALCKPFQSGQKCEDDILDQLELSKVRYSSPEIISRSGYNEKADVFSYGSIFYLLNSKLEPFHEESPRIACERFKMNQRPEYAKKFVPKKESRDLLNKLWNQDPDLRISMNEVIEKLDAMRSKPCAIM